MEGTITHVNVAKRFGFIKPDGAAHRDLYFSPSALSRALDFGEQLVELRVSFDIETTARGSRATDIQPAK